ncbi:replication initiator [Spirillospora sp. CA-294931]|uniref:replication initiator n=1 Tax=Spirillospora sp. CA-294931 TaxID=3240042 RepID=UPI003D8A5725
MAARVADDSAWREWQRQVEHTGHCVRPVRVRGGAAAVDTGTGEVLAEYSTAGRPDGALLLACKDRRSAVCPACAETYRRDTWHVIAAGLRGRTAAVPGGVDAVPASVAGHPVVLATFTAPSFGAVHRAGDAACRARSGRPMCPHKVSLTCDARHGGGDARVGTPLCWDCYDYAGHVLWHAAVPEVWRRTVIYLYRALARVATERTGTRVTVRAVRGHVRVSYVKVAEFQKRAAVHLHAVLRLDGVDADAPERVTAPPAWADVSALEAAIRDAAARVAVRLPEVGGRTRKARWGAQLDVAPIIDPERAAAYLAKYATKTAGDVLAGLPARRFGRSEADRIRRRVANPHVMLLVAMCFRLSRLPDCAGFALDLHPHTLGFRGHFATKSRRYSVTLGVLRGVRRSWRARSRPGGDVWARAGDVADDGTVIVREWRYLGTGWARPGDANLAAGLALDHAAARAAFDLAMVARAGEAP